MNDRGDVARPTDVPAYGAVGPEDPHADPPTDPAVPLPAGPTEPIDAGPGRRPDRTVFSGLYLGLILAALVLVFLLVFIVQNPDSVTITFLWMSGQLPVGVALLLAAVAGVLLVAIPGSGRILQLRRAARRKP